jgi:cation:H+ antiporter
LVWIKFAICCAIILVAGTRLSKYGDVIAEKTGMGRVWIGAVLLAAVTSLPELMTGISSVVFVGEPNLTIGDLFGSNLFNLLAIAIIDVFYRYGPVLHYLSWGMVLTAASGALLIGTVAGTIYVAQNVSSMSLFNYIGLYTPAIFSLYIFMQFLMLRYEHRELLSVPLAEGEEPPTLYQDISMRRAITVFALAALATAGAGTWLAFIGNELSMATGLEASFVGTLFLAFATSTPEIVVSVSALRLGAPDMAVGNVLGSNLFNMGVVLVVDDLFYTAGPILSAASSDHIFTAVIAMLISAIVIIGVVFRPRFRPRSWISIDTVAIVLLYIGAMFVLYIVSAN